MLLLYDAKCQICRSLAQKIYFHTGKNVDIRSLSSPEAHEVLREFYPDGWEHDFYVVHDGTCKKGTRALPKLLASVGPRHMASLLAEFGYYKLTPRSCGHDSSAGAQQSKRNFLKLAALSPLLYGFSKIKGEDPFEKPIDGFLVNVAEVEKLGFGDFQTKVYRCKDCLRVPKKQGGVPKGSNIHLIEDAVLAEVPLPKLASNGQGTASLKVKRLQFENEWSRNGRTSRASRTLHTGLLDHPRFGIALNFGQAQVTSLAGMAHHDLPVTVLDWVVYKTEADDAAAHIAAYADGVRALSELHQREGRQELGALYQEMSRSLEEMPARFEQAVHDQILPVRNEFVITSMPEALRFVQLPRGLKPKSEAVVAGCDCSCSCDACCGCGCGLGICLTPFPCFCDCCISCGCGCGCCLGGGEEPV